MHSPLAMHPDTAGPRLQRQSMSKRRCDERSSATHTIGSSRRREKTPTSTMATGESSIFDNSSDMIHRRRAVDIEFDSLAYCVNVGSQKGLTMAREL